MGAPAVGGVGGAKSAPALTEPIASPPTYVSGETTPLIAAEYEEEDVPRYDKGEVVEVKGKGGAYEREVLPEDGKRGGYGATLVASPKSN